MGTTTTSVFLSDVPVVSTTIVSDTLRVALVDSSIINNVDVSVDVVVHWLSYV